MAYATDAKIRSRSGITTAEISTADMTNIITAADTEVDAIIENAYYYSEYFDNLQDEKIIIMNKVSTVSDFIKIEIDGKELYEEDRYELMNNGDVEELNSDATGGVEDWTYVSGTSATFTHSATAHWGRKSLLITSGAQEDAYWYTTNSISVTYPQDYLLPAYIFTYYVKTTDIVAGDGNGAYIKILWYNGDTLLATDDNSASAITDTADWTKVTLTKYAPDSASSVVLQLVNDAESGSAYFDTMKFRKANWIDKISDASVNLLKRFSKNFLTVWYSKTDTINPLIENLSNDVGARMTLVKVLGGTSTGMSYKIDVLQVNKNSKNKERTILIKQLTESIKEKIMRLEQQGLLKDNKDDWKVGLNIYV